MLIRFDMNDRCDLEILFLIFFSENISNRFAKDVPDETIFMLHFLLTFKVSECQ